MDVRCITSRARRRSTKKNFRNQDPRNVIKILKTKNECLMNERRTVEGRQQTKGEKSWWWRLIRRLRAPNDSKLSAENEIWLSYEVDIIESAVLGSIRDLDLLSLLCSWPCHHQQRVLITLRGVINNFLHYSLCKSSSRCAQPSTPVAERLRDLLQFYCVDDDWSFVRAFEVSSESLNFQFPSDDDGLQTA